MKIILIIILILSNKIIAKEVGQIEITTEAGIEVFQNEKYYLLKENVHIISDNFELSANFVKAFFENDLYDIVRIESQDNVTLISSQGMKAKGGEINFSTKNENITIKGAESSLIYGNIQMFSNELIKVNNMTGEFNLKGENSELKTDSIYILGKTIDGRYINIEGINEIDELLVGDPNQSNIKTKNINMFSKKASYSKKEDLIELFDNVKIIRDNEVITGDYAKIDTLNQSYKVFSKNSKKVKILIKNSDE